MKFGNDFLTIKFNIVDQMDPFIVYIRPLHVAKKCLSMNM